MYLSEVEEIIAYIVCIAIVIGFGVSTYMEIKNTVREEREKHQEQKENEEKIKVLIDFFKTKKNWSIPLLNLKRSNKKKKIPDFRLHLYLQQLKKYYKTSLLKILSHRRVIIWRYPLTYKKQ